MFPYKQKKPEFNPEHCMLEDIFGEDVPTWGLLSWVRKYCTSVGTPAVDGELFDTFLAIKWFYDEYYPKEFKTYELPPQAIYREVERLEQATFFGDEKKWTEAFNALKDVCEQIFKHRREHGSSTKYMCRKTKN